MLHEVGQRKNLEGDLRIQLSLYSSGQLLFLSLNFLALRSWLLFLKKSSLVNIFQCLTFFFSFLLFFFVVLGFELRA
jgi:hypothetical protein